MNNIFLLASNTILDASKKVGIGQFLQGILSIICLIIDSVVYFLITIAYKLFLALAQFELFNDEAFEYLINRTYLVIGVISLFLIAYALLNSIINPDNNSKNNKSFGKIVKNFIIAVIGIALVPTIFNYFYYFQRVVLCNNLIPRVILQQENADATTLDNVATELPELIFESFFYPNSIVADGSSGDNSDDLVSNAAADIVIDASNPNQDSDTYSLAEAYTNAKNGMSFWTAFNPFIFSSPGVIDNSIQYLVILSTIAGGYIAYVFVSLCLDMGVRVVKLGYLELIAPLAIMTTIVPGQDGVFKNWSKKTISCALEVFTRLFVVVFAVYLVGTIKNILQPSFGTTICGIELNVIYVLLLRAIIYFSIFAFAKKAPKFFSEATGIKSDGFKIGLLDKMKENGMAQAFGATGAFATTGIRNVVTGAKTGGVVGAFKAGKNSIPTALKAGQKGWKQTGDIKKWSDIKNGINTASTEAEEEYQRWENQKKENGGSAIKTIKKNIGGSISDFFENPEAGYKNTKAKYDKLSEAVKAKKGYVDWTSDLLSKDKYKSLFKYGDGDAAKTWGELEQAKVLAEKTRDEAIKQVANSRLMVGDDSYTSEAISNEREEADAEVAKLENLSKMVLPKTQMDDINHRLAQAKTRQANAYAKQADYSKTTAGVAEIQRNAEKALISANQQFATADSALRKAKTEIEKGILNGLDASIVNGDENTINKIMNEISPELETHISEMRRTTKDAMSELTNSANYGVINEAVNDNNNNSKLYDAADKIKQENYEVLAELNKYGDSIRKKSDKK